ncbi:MAG: hypothetical protein GX879_11670, partial [Bacteroidales bacterium]|nr:hypothetical protein [Bacteroidales bacterium]
MSYTKNKFEASDGVNIVYHKWIPESEDIKAVLVIAHGMAEHAYRYDDFAKFLNVNNFAVYA